MKEKDFIQYLSYQEDTYIHFEYEKEIYYVIYGPNREEGTVGKGRTLGQAIYDLTEKFFEDDVQLEYELLKGDKRPWEPVKDKQILEGVRSPQVKQPIQTGLGILKIILNRRTISLVK
jgi:hypothetical protein